MSNMYAASEDILREMIQIDLHGGNPADHVTRLSIVYDIHSDYVQEMAESFMITMEDMAAESLT